MTPLLTSLKQVNTDDLETHIDDLLRQKDILQKIEHYTNDRIDFGDMLETYNLLVGEIERLREELREQRGSRLVIEFEEEEEEMVSSSTQREIEDQERFLELVRGRMEEDKMGQQEVVDFLRKYQPRWFTSSQIVEAVQLSRASVNSCLSRLRKHSEIKEKTVKVVLKSGLGLVEKDLLFYSYKKR